MTRIFWLLFTIKMFGSLIYVETAPQSGVISGGFTGASTSDRLTHNMTNTTHPTMVPAIMIERGESYPNGCFKQIVREPDYSDVRRYVSTEQLICPANVNITTISHQYLKPSNVTGHPVAPHYAPAYHTPALLPVPVNATPIAVLPPPSSPLAPLPPVLTQQKDQPDVFHPRQPVMAEIPNAATSQVIVLSQNTGYYDTKKKTNSASTILLAVNINVIIFVISIFTYFM